MDPSRVGELRAFIDACKKDPALLADPSLAFFRDYLTSLGAHIPTNAGPKPSAAGPKVAPSSPISSFPCSDPPLLPRCSRSPFPPDRPRIVIRRVPPR